MNSGAASNHASPLATVAMVTYNSARFVRTAIESVLSQTYSDFELVICDDRSTDGTWEIVQSYSDRRIRAFRNETNLREYPNRNRALELSRGEYIIYIDGDDILYPHGLGFMVGMLEAFPRAAMAMARPWSEKFVYPVELDPRTFYRCQFLGPDVLAINFAHLLMRTSVLREVGGLSTRYRCGDAYIQYRIGLTHPALLVSDGIAWWRRTPGQASERMLRDHVHVQEALEYSMDLLHRPECPLTPDEVRQAESNLHGGYIRLAARCIAQGRVQRGVEMLRQARLPLSTWRYTLVPGKREFMRDVSAVAPLWAGLEQNPFARGVDRAGP